MNHVVSVRPAHDGWAVASSAGHGPFLFARASDAEDAALEIGEDLANDGEPSEVHIHLRDGTMAARFVCGPYSRPVVHWTPAPPLSRDRVGVAA